MKPLGMGNEVVRRMLVIEFGDDAAVFEALVPERYVYQGKEVLWQDTEETLNFFTFVGARVLHTIFYMLSKQPFRTIGFAIDAFAVIGMAVNVILAAI